MPGVNVKELEQAKDIDGLIAALKDADENVREEATRALMWIGNDQSVEALIPLLDDPYSYDPSVVFRGNRSYEEMGDDAPVYPVRRAAFDTLQNLLTKSKPLPNVGAMLENRDVDGLTKALRFLMDEEDLIRLQKMGNPSLHKVLSAIDGYSRVYRAKAAEALNKLGDRRAADALLEVLEDDDSRIREHAIRAMGNFSEWRAVDALLRILEKEKDKKNRQWAMWALGKIGDARAVEPLIGILSDPDSFTRADAVRPLGQIRDVRAVDALGKCLEDPDEYVRSEAKKALR